MNNLRFAPIVRVSTETQAKKGESLRTQQGQIEQYVKQLGGNVVSWDYSGQEHATPDQERDKLDKLLADCSKGLFDAVIVCDLSRWSRDNRRSKEGLKILQANKIRFYVGPSEYDLSNPEKNLFIGMATEMNEFFALNQSLKSIQSRINRANRGMPTTGKLPYGRTWNKKTGWGIDQEKQKNIEYAAERYLAGESMGAIAKKLGMNHPNLWKILTKRSGTKWINNFTNNKFNINETVIVPIPALLSEEVIADILNQGASNKTYTHGQLKNRYLLGRVVFCSECGHAMFGQTNHGNRRYYRHPRGRIKACDSKIWVPAEQLEDAVMVNLFAMFGNIDRIEKAVKKATPDDNLLNLLHSRIVAIEKDMEGIIQQKTNMVRAIRNGTITDEEAGPEMRCLREREGLLIDEKVRIESELQALPKYRKRLSSLAQSVRAECLLLNYLPEKLGKMDYDEKRKVIQAAFAGMGSVVNSGHQTSYAAA